MAKTVSKRGKCTEPIVGGDTVDYGDRCEQFDEANSRKRENLETMCCGKCKYYKPKTLKW